MHPSFECFMYFEAEKKFSQKKYFLTTLNTLIQIYTISYAISLNLISTP